MTCFKILFETGPFYDVHVLRQFHIREIEIEKNKIYKNVVF